VAYFFEDQEFGDEGAGQKYGEQSKTYNLPEVLTLLKEFRVVLDNKTAEDTYNPRVMMTEAAKLPLNNLVEYY
jgi:hypothetical protein